MDCRLSLLVTLALVGVCGCTESRKHLVLPGGASQQKSGGIAAQQPEPPPAARERAGGKRQPLPGTHVSWAVYREREANAPNTDPAQKPKILDQARMAYLKAIEVDPGHLPAYTGLARVYVQLGIPERAQETYQKALKRFPKEGSLWYELGMIHCRQKDWPNAIEHLKKAHDLEPENRQFAQTYGFCLARAGRTDESLTCLTRVMGAAQAHYNVARMLVHLQREDQARQHLHLALQRDPHLQAAGQLLARIDGRGTDAGARPEMEIHFGDEKAFVN
jgi:tetratricopeptide (TPR) repeat protein